MGIREQMNEKPKFTIGAVALLLVAAIGLALWANSDGMPKPATQAYFSVDDGKTYFADDIGKVAPFDHNGSPAVRAYVYRCGSGEPFVAYMERLTEASRAKYAELQSKPAEEVGNALGDLLASGVEVKKPGEAKWSGVATREGMAVKAITCPDGGTDLQGVYP